MYYTFTSPLMNLEYFISCSLAAQLTLVIHNCNRKDGRREWRRGEGRRREGRGGEGSIIGVLCKSHSCRHNITFLLHKCSISTTIYQIFMRKFFYLFIKYK